MAVAGGVSLEASAADGAEWRPSVPDAEMSHDVPGSPQALVAAGRLVPRAVQGKGTGEARRRRSGRKADRGRFLVFGVGELARAC